MPVLRDTSATTPSPRKKCLSTTVKPVQNKRGRRPKKSQHGSLDTGVSRPGRGRPRTQMSLTNTNKFLKSSQEQLPCPSHIPNPIKRAVYPTSDACFPTQSHQAEGHCRELAKSGDFPFDHDNGMPQLLKQSTINKVKKYKLHYCESCGVGFKTKSYMKHHRCKVYGLNGPVSNGRLKNPRSVPVVKTTRRLRRLPGLVRQKGSRKGDEIKLTVLVSRKSGRIETLNGCHEYSNDFDLRKYDDSINHEHTIRGILKLIISPNHCIEFLVTVSSAAAKKCIDPLVKNASSPVNLISSLSNYVSSFEQKKLSPCLAEADAVISNTTIDCLKNPALSTNQLTNPMHVNTNPFTLTNRSQDELQAARTILALAYCNNTDALGNTDFKRLGLTSIQTNLSCYNTIATTSINDTAIDRELVCDQSELFHLMLHRICVSL